MCNIPEIFNTLPGHWTLNRTITGHGRMEGSARFTPDGPGRLLYSESGSLMLEGGQVFDSFRNTLYRLENDTITAYFMDGEASPRPFHTLDFSSDGQSATATHPCGPDMYDGVYDFFGFPDTFSIVWTVTGPRKNYVSTTVYTRARTSS